jgi:hypothetical protein
VEPSLLIFDAVPPGESVGIIQVNTLRPAALVKIESHVPSLDLRFHSDKEAQHHEIVALINEEANLGETYGKVVIHLCHNEYREKRELWVFGSVGAVQSSQR